ncbi:MAG: hypothetical protein IJ783_00275, partial [Kiritimatiellae bacterium]|nr:hypothetical protein [Kiritimatiellia bacterium]
MKAAKFLPVAAVVAALAAVAARFAWAQAALVRAESAGGGSQALPFLLVSAALCLGPGLFAWRAAGLRTSSVAFFLAFVPAAGIGCTMLVSWLLLLFGLWTPRAALALALASGAAGLAAVASWTASRRRRSASCGGAVRALASVTLSEALAVALAFAVAETLFELVAGSPMQGWDAFLSWDRWAEEFAAGRSLGRRALGFYPPGLPLVGSVFYKLLPASGPVPASAAHLLLHGFHAGAFPLVALLAVCALSRPCGFNPLVGQALLLSDWFLVQCALKQAGDADVPLVAMCLCAFAVVAELGEAASKRRVAAAAVPVFFAVAFAKGSGFAALAFALPFLFWRKRAAACPAAAALAFAAPFYAVQAALAA